MKSPHRKAESMPRAALRHGLWGLGAALGLLWGASLQGRSQATPSLPPLRPLPFESLQPAVRAVVQKAYDAALAHAEDASANGKLGMVLQAYSVYEDAEICYRRAHVLDPGSFRWAYYLAWILASEGRCDEAIPNLREALRLSPEYLPASLKLGDCLLTTAEWEQAETTYRAILQKDPQNAPANYGLGRVRAARKDLKGAVESFRSACQVFPNYGAAHYALGLAYRDSHQDDQAREELALYQKYRAAAPEVEDPLQDEVRALDQSANSQLAAAATLVREGKIEAAVAAYENALKGDPQLAEAHVNLIHLYGKRGEFQKATEHYQAAVRLQPTYEASHLNYAIVLVQAGKLPQAQEAFRKVLEISPYNSDAHFGLGDLLQRDGKLQEAAGELRKALENRPDFPQAQFNLGRILVNQQNYSEGIEHLLKSLQTEDENLKATYLYAVGAAYARAGDREKALNYLREAHTQAEAHHQARLVSSIERDLQIVEGATGPQ